MEYKCLVKTSSGILYLTLSLHVHAEHAEHAEPAVSY